MGELIDFAKYKAKKEEDEAKKIDEDIKQLKAEIEFIIKDMEQPCAPHVFLSGYDEMLPFMTQVISTLNTYYDTENTDEER